MEQVMKKRMLRGLVGLCLVVLVGVGAYRYYGVATDPIQAYQPAQDRDTVAQIFEQNWYWLINVPYKEALAAFADDLDKAESLIERQKQTALQWSVFKEGGVVKGFVAYNIISPGLGRILFLAVDERYRGHGSAQRLIQHAIDKLEAAGCKTIKILVRIENFRAQNLYRKVGFEAVKTDDTFMYMERVH